MKASLSFIHSSLDDAGLSLSEFRLYCHLLRRGECFSSANTIAEVCRMHVDTVWPALRSLERRGLIVREARRGRTSLIRVSANPNPLEKEGPPPDYGLPSRGESPVAPTGKKGSGVTGKEGVAPTGKGGLQSVSPEVPPIQVAPIKAPIALRAPPSSAVVIDGKRISELKAEAERLNAEIAKYPNDVFKRIELVGNLGGITARLGNLENGRAEEFRDPSYRWS